MAKTRILNFKQLKNNSLSQLHPILPPVEVVTVERDKAIRQSISKDFMESLLRTYFGDLLQSEFNIRCIVSDTNYLPVDLNWLLGTIQTDPILAPQSYKNDVFDCDDYVLYVKTRIALYAAQTRLSFPLAVGYLLTCRHAFNICVTTDLQGDPSVAIINTQSSARQVATDPGTFRSFLDIAGVNYVQSVYI